MFNGVDARETLALAALACDVRGDSPHIELCGSVVDLLQKAEQAAGEGGQAPAEPDESAPRARQIVPGVAFAIAASALVRTPDVPLPRVTKASVSTPAFPVSG
jgi:hypothetical protein